MHDINPQCAATLASHTEAIQSLKESHLIIVGKFDALDKKREERNTEVDGKFTKITYGITIAALSPWAADTVLGTGVTEKIIAYISNLFV